MWDGARGRPVHLSCCFSEATQSLGRRSHTVSEGRHVPGLTVLGNPCHGFTEDLNRRRGVRRRSAERVCTGRPLERPTLEFSITLSMQSKYERSLTGSLWLSSIPLTAWKTTPWEKSFYICVQTEQDESLTRSLISSHLWLKSVFFFVIKEVFFCFFFVLPPALWGHCHTPSGQEPAECTGWSAG